MASFVKHPSLVFLSFLVFSTLGTGAREGWFSFSKMIRTENPTTGPSAVAPEASPRDKTDSTMLPPKKNQNGYGLYGRGPEQFSRFSPTTTTINNNNNNNNNKKFNGGKFPSSFSGENPTNENYYGDMSNGKRFDDNNYSPSKFSNEEFTQETYVPSYNERNGQYGMSDTRFMENGRYYYDVHGKRYGYGYESNPMRTDSEAAHGSYGGADERQGGYGNRGAAYGYGYGNGNEYNNGVDVYRNREEYERSREEYVP